MVKFGNRVKQIRISKGKSQLEIATDAGFDVSHIGRIERGTQNTSVSHIAAIAQALKVKPMELFDFE